ncbi:MAG: hypothetical protein IKN17_06575 [Ruminococcus sp.]|nr:hypothetical protein [Ruminococcus sp.]
MIIAKGIPLLLFILSCFFFFIIADTSLLRLRFVLSHYTPLHTSAQVPALCKMCVEFENFEKCLDFQPSILYNRRGGQSPALDAEKLSIRETENFLNERMSVSWQD